MARVVIVGAGQGGTSVLKAFMGLDSVQLAGICDVDDRAPGIVLARDKRIPTYNDLPKMLSLPNIDVIIEATGNSRVQEIIAAHKAPGCSLVDAHAANILMSMVESRDAMSQQIVAEAQVLVDIGNNLDATIHSVRSSIEDVARSAMHIAEKSIQLTNSAVEATQHISETGEVLSFIKTVAQHTKMLGLNAAIEAARAGEHGRGFTVVADEVRKLADNSTASIERIAPVLTNIENSITIITSGVQNSSEISQQQAAATQEVAASIQLLESMSLQLATSAKRLSSLIQ